MRERSAVSCSAAISASRATSRGAGAGPEASSLPRLWISASDCKTESWIWRASDSRSPMLLQQERAGVEIRVDPKRIQDVLDRDPPPRDDPKHG